MATLQTKNVSRQDLELSRRSIIIHDLNMETTLKKIMKVLEGKVNVSEGKIKFGKSYEIDGKTRQKAFINFKNEDKVNELMKNRPYVLGQKELSISRYNPKLYKLSGHITSFLSINFCETKYFHGFRKENLEYQLNEYFKKLCNGNVVGCEWKSNNEVVVKFEDYDSVDQIILHDILHTLDNIKINVEKILPISIIKIPTYDSLPYCIHVTKLPNDVTSEELAFIFRVHVADIVLRPANHRASYLTSNIEMNSEAWIKGVGDQEAAQALVSKIPGRKIHEFEIHCNVIRESINVAELCRDFEKGNCIRTPEICYFKHIMCHEPIKCDNKECWYGHDKTRKLVSTRKPTQDADKSFYRIRFSNLPLTITKEQLQKTLNIRPKDSENLRLSEDPTSNLSMVAYLIEQPSENFLRRKIRQWHDTVVFEDSPKKVKCQLEMNMNFFNWVDKDGLLKTNNRSQTSSSILNTNNNLDRSVTNLAPWCNRKNEVLPIPFQIEESNSEDYNSKQFNSIKKKDKSIVNVCEPTDLAQFAPEWRWTNINRSSDQTVKNAIYLLVNKTNKHKAIIKLYLTQHKALAQSYAIQERIALEKLEGLCGVPKFIVSNISSENEIETNNFPWIIMDYIEGDTLYDFIKKSQLLSLGDKLEITLKLLNIVKEIHRHQVIHCNINPHNVIIIGNKSNTDGSSEQSSLDTMSFVLTDFSLAIMDQDFNKHSMNIINDIDNQPEEVFYRVPQMEKQPSGNDRNENEHEIYSSSASIDTSHICAILFWMITKSCPRESRDIHNQAPHQLKNHSNRIEEELEKASGIWTKTDKRIPLGQHLNLIFDHGFAGPNRQWSIEELSYQLRHLIQLTKENNGENSSFALTLSKKQIESSSNNSKSDMFIQLVSIVDWLKRQIEIYYPNIHWSTNNVNKWHGSSQEIQNKDILTVKKQQILLNIPIIWCARLNRNQELELIITAKINTATNATLFLGIWKQYEQEVIKEKILKSFQSELKILIDILSENKNI